jgi:RNA polymerase sigma factor
MVLFFRRATPSVAALEQRVLAAQNDGEAREKLIQDYIPFVLKVVAKSVGRFVKMGEDDEVSIGLIAFDEAISCYQTERNGAFLGFAETVIKRRLVDHYRRQGSKWREVPISTFVQSDDDNAALNRVEIQAAHLAYVHSQAQEERREEIRRFDEQLHRFGISMAELAEISPKHHDARLRAREAARIVSGSADHWNHLCERGELRLKELETLVSVSRKTLERQRKYIIALAIILAGDYPHLADYLTE